MIKTIIIGMPMFVSLFWTALLLTDMIVAKKCQRTRLHLLTFMMAATVLYWGHCAFFTHSSSFMPLADTLYAIANLSVYPLYYFYICSLTIRREHHQLRWLLLLPALMGGICIGALYVRMSEAETRQFVSIYLYAGGHNGLTGLAIIQAFTHDLCKILFALLLIPIFFLGRHHLLEYERLLNESYSDTDRKNLTSLHYMFVAFLATTVFSFVANIIGKHEFDHSIGLLSIPSLIFSVLLFTLGYIGMHQQFSIETIELDEQQADADMHDSQKISELRIRIEQLMQQEELYRQPNLKIVDLVRRLGTNRSYVYQAINREMGMSFNEYVNRMRIDYAEHLLTQEPQKTFSETADMAGFTSASSFYRNFKLYRGMGPKEFMEKNKNNK